MDDLDLASVTDPYHKIGWCSRELLKGSWDLVSMGQYGFKELGL